MHFLQIMYLLSVLHYRSTILKEFGLRARARFRARVWRVHTPISNPWWPTNLASNAKYGETLRNYRSTIRKI